MWRILLYRQNFSCAGNNQVNVQFFKKTSLHGHRKKKSRIDP